MRRLLLMLLAAGQPTPLDPRDIIRAAAHAVEVDSVSALSTAWQGRLAREPRDVGALLGLASLARLRYQYPHFDSLVARLDPLLPGHDLAAAYATLERGRAARDRGEADSASAFYTIAAATAWRLADSAATVEALVERAGRESALGRHARADSLLTRARAILPRADAGAEAAYRCMRASTWASRGDARAVQEGERGAARAEQAGNARLVMQCRLAGGELKARAGDYDAILRDLRAVAERAERLHDRTSAGWARTARGASLLSYGNIGDGVSDLRAAAAHGAATGNRDREAQALTNLAQAYYYIGDDETGNDMARRAIVLHDQVRDDGVARASATVLRGDLAAAQGREREAIALYERAASQFQEAGRPPGVALAVGLLAGAVARAGDLDRADALLRSSLIAARRTQRARDPETYYQLGAIALKRGRLRDAARHFRTGASGAGAESDLRYHFGARLAEIRALEGDVKGAASDLTAASASLDAWRASLSDRDLRAQAFSANRDDLDPDLGVATILSAMAAGGRAPEAFLLAERRRARELLDQLNRGDATRPNAPDVARARPPGTPPGAPEVTRALPPAVVLVEYVTGRGGEPTTAFVISSGGMRSLTLSPVDSLSSAIVLFNTLLEKGGDPTVVAGRLRREVLDPVLGLVPPGTRTLLVVPDGALHSLPFDALLLLQATPPDIAVSTVPSAAVTLSLWKRSPTREPSMLAFADPLYDSGNAAAGSEAETYRSAFAARGGLPRLEGSAREVERVARYAPGATLLVREGASESTLKRDSLERFTILHFATHALVSERSTTRTALALAAGNGEDGFVGPGELAALHLNADLVVLSACQTAGGRLLRGEGIQGLTAPLLAAGARAVLATNWPVGDRSTGAFMDAFYRAVAAGQPLGAALRTAKLEARRAGMPTRAWGAFMLVGDPTIRIALALPPDRPWRAWLAAALAALALGLVVLRRIRRTHQGGPVDLGAPTPT